MIKVLKKLATNKKGSEIVEKIFMVVASIALAAIAIAFILSKINEVAGKNIAGADDKGNITTAVPTTTGSGS